MGNVTAPVDHILWLDFKRSRVVNLLEVACEVTLMVVLPLDEARDLVSELGVRDVIASLVHCSLVATLARRCPCVVPEATSLIAGLDLSLASDNVKDESIARDFLVGFYFNDVSCLDAAPVR